MQSRISIWLRSGVNHVIIDDFEWVRELVQGGSENFVRFVDEDNRSVLIRVTEIASFCDCGPVQDTGYRVVPLHGPTARTV